MTRAPVIHVEVIDQTDAALDMLRVCWCALGNRQDLAEREIEAIYNMIDKSIRDLQPAREVVNQAHGRS